MNFFRRRKLKKKLHQELIHTKETVYPSDISDWYEISYETAQELLEELVKEGKARRV